MMFTWREGEPVRRRRLLQRGRSAHCGQHLDRSLRSERAVAYSDFAQIDRGLLSLEDVLRNVGLPRELDLAYGGERDEKRLTMYVPA